MTSYSNTHILNIIIHITAGLIALIIGIVALLSKKGGRWHRKSGRIFIRSLIIVILTGLVGVLIFKRNTFLLIITILSAYYGFSGYRIIKTKSNKLKIIDVIIAVISLFSVFYFLYYFNSIGMYWSPIIIYSTVGALLLIICYDFFKYLIPIKSYNTIWLYEHIYKMIGAFTALLSAFTGTVLNKYQPYSQFLPSIFGGFLQIGLIVYYKNKQHTTKNIRNSGF